MPPFQYILTENKNFRLFAAERKMKTANFPLSSAIGKWEFVFFGWVNDK
jgi:hypothetical protein